MECSYKNTHIPQYDTCPSWQCCVVSDGLLSLSETLLAVTPSVNKLTCPEGSFNGGGAGCGRGFFNKLCPVSWQRQIHLHFFKNSKTEVCFPVSIQKPQVIQIHVLNHKYIDMLINLIWDGAERIGWGETQIVAILTHLQDKK